MIHCYQFPMISATATVFLYRKNHGKYEYLLGKRSEDSSAYAGYDSLPGGYLDAKTDKAKGENIVQTALREMKEEVGAVLDERKLVLLNQYSDPSIDPRGHVINLVFLYEIEYEDSLKLKAGDDLSAISWHGFESVVSGLAFNHDEIVKEAVEKLTNRMKLI